jgi:ABC-type amino acid transport substrate-binding protein
MKRFATILALIVAVAAQVSPKREGGEGSWHAELQPTERLPASGFLTRGKWMDGVEFCQRCSRGAEQCQQVKFMPLSAKDRFTALQSGEVDVLVRNTTWTSSRDTSLGLNFVGVNYYDGQGFMVRKALKVNSALELNGAAVCVQQGTTTELNLADYFGAHKMQLKTVTFATANEAVKAYDAGRCDPTRPTPRPRGVASRSLIISLRNRFRAAGPWCARGKFDVVNRTLYAMLDAGFNVMKISMRRSKSQ